MPEATLRSVRDLAELERAYDVAAAATEDPDDHASWRFDAVRDGFPACQDVDLVAEVDGRVVGAALSFRDEGGVRVRVLGVDPAYQGRGLGLRLMGAVTDAAWRAGDQRLYLGAESGAVAFYRRAGFSLVERAYGVTVFEKTRDAERRLTVTPDAPWLPAGSDAEVYSAEGGEPPEPVCLVRVLARREDEVFLVETPKGLDLPSRFVAQRPEPGQWRGALSELCGELGLATPTSCVGYVRNIVPAPDETYPFPTPHAHFVVLGTHQEPVAPGRWTPRAEAERSCGDRHWWPLVAATIGG